MRLERLSTANKQAALDYLARAPYDNVLLSYLILFDASPSTRNSIVIATQAERICGVAYMGRQLLLACEDAAIEAFARRAERHGGERSISGPRKAVRAFWKLVQERRAAPRLMRDRQLTMVVGPTTLRGWSPVSASVRLARADEWPKVAENSAQMIESELAYDPRQYSPEFFASIRTMIDQSRWWVGESNGQLCFFCSIGPWCRATAQLQSIWTPPELRRRGLATASLGAICNALLHDIPSLCLHVNDFNDHAIALYRRLGFAHVSDYSTILF